MLTDRPAYRLKFSGAHVTQPCHQIINESLQTVEPRVVRELQCTIGSGSARDGHIGAQKREVCMYVHDDLNNEGFR